MRIEKCIEWHPDKRSWHVGYIAWTGHVRHAEAMEWVAARVNDPGIKPYDEAWPGWPPLLKKLGECGVENAPP